MAPKLPASFDELLKNRYGVAEPGDTRFSLRIDDLLAGRYGLSPADRAPAISRTASLRARVSLRRDDGEVLSQRMAGRRQYLAQQSSVGPQIQEYVAPAGLECRVYVDDPLKDLQPAPPELPPSQAFPSAPPAALTPSTVSGGAPTAPSEAKSVDDDFIADMKSILSGQKVFDPAQKQMVARNSAPAVSTQTSRPDPPGPDGKDPGAIFDRIKRSMTYANAYDLGSVDLENRFADFDATADAEQRAKAAKKAKAASPPAAQALPPVNSDDLLDDLDAIRSGHQAGVSTAQSRPGYSEPFFDTGEHVQIGGDQYAGRLRVGQSPGVTFSYGQIVAMGDLFEDDEQMMRATPAELTRLKELIDRSTAHYTQHGPDVGTEDWEGATSERYLKLAEDNFEHFSPNPLAGTRGYPGGRGSKGDNKAAWQRYHGKAIEKAQKMFLAQQAPASIFYEGPLIVNAFGDHYLTDAFASGHVLNKEVMIDKFKSRFLSGGDLKPAAKRFFSMVAHKAFRGKVKQQFKVLETADYPICKFGWCFKWRPNIDSAGMFATLLERAAEEQPDRVGNVAVKALHDHLNKHGIDVVNDAGDRPWLLKGDVFMDATTLRIAKRAVQQSIDNINDPAIMGDNLNFGPFFDRVWKHVPQLTPPSKNKLANLMDDYTNPESPTLVNAAADIIYNEVDALAKSLVTLGKLKEA